MGGETLYAIAWMYDLDVNALARANNLREPYTVTPSQILTVDPRALAGQGSATGSNQPVAGSATVTAVPSGTGLSRSPLPSSGITRQPLPDSGSTRPGQASGAASGSSSGTGSRPANATPVPPATSTPVTGTPPTAASPADSSASVASPVGRFSGDSAITWDWPYKGTVVGRFVDTAVEGKGLDLAGSAGDSILAAADGEVVYAGSGLLRYGNLLILKHNDHFLSAYAHNRSLLVKEGEVVRRGQKIAELGSSGVDRNMLHFEIRQDGKPVDPQQFLPGR